MKETMKTLENRKEMEVLRFDLQMSFSLATSIYEKTSGDWIYGIDPENMIVLKSIYKSVDGSYSLNQVAHAIRKGKNLKCTTSL